MGVPAGFLNSSLSSEQRTLILRRASEGHYRLLYLSPERIALDGTPAWLGRVPVSFFAIDEAHCISEWGHDFRPEYRQLSRLRELFPDRPIAAFTASATQRVRHDIIEQLRLRDPYKHIASFRRPNLRYIVRQTDARTQNELVLRAVKKVSDGSIIVYAPTITRVGDTVDFLEENGIAAIGYHGQMESAARRENQEKWMADEVRVMVGTMAFGLGINKAAVRAVIHLSLPKSVEQYYQEAGRAGRDTLPADCFLFWQRKTPACTRFHWQNRGTRPKKNAPGSGTTKSKSSCNPRNADSATSASTSEKSPSGNSAAIAMRVRRRRTGWKSSCNLRGESATPFANRRLSTRQRRDPQRHVRLWLR